MSGATPPGRDPLERADAPRVERIQGGFFPFAPPGPLPLPFWVLSLYLFLATSQLDEYVPALEALRPRSVLGALALAFALGHGLRASVAAGHFALRPAPTVWLLAFVLASGLSALWAFDPTLAGGPFLEHLTALASYFLLLGLVRTRRQAGWTVLVIAAGVGTFLLLSVLEFRGGRHDHAQGVVRMIGIGSSYADPNSFAATVCFALPLVLWAGLTARAWLVRLAALAYAALAVYAVFMSSSRSAIVLLGLTALWLVTLLPGRALRLGYVGLLAAVALGMLAGLSDAQKARLASIADAETYARDASTLGRIEGVRVGLRIVAERPLLGVGPGNWAAYRTRRVDGRDLMPHNLAAELFATRGILGALAFLGFLAASARFGLREMRRRRGLLAPWDRAVGTLAWTCLFSLGLLLVAGLGAHNLTRANWAWLPALMIVAARASPDTPPGEPTT